jgi:hypothetical protein
MGREAARSIGQAQCLRAAAAHQQSVAVRAGAQRGDRREFARRELAGGPQPWHRGGLSHGGVHGGIAAHGGGRGGLRGIGRRVAGGWRVARSGAAWPGRGLAALGAVWSARACGQGQGLQRCVGDLGLLFAEEGRLGGGAGVGIGQASEAGGGGRAAALCRRAGRSGNRDARGRWRRGGANREGGRRARNAVARDRGGYSGRAGQGALNRCLARSHFAGLDLRGQVFLQAPAAAGVVGDAVHLVHHRHAVDVHGRVHHLGEQLEGGQVEHLAQHQVDRRLHHVARALGDELAGAAVGHLFLAGGVGDSAHRKAQRVFVDAPVQAVQGAVERGYQIGDGRALDQRFVFVERRSAQAGAAAGQQAGQRQRGEPHGPGGMAWMGEPAARARLSTSCLATRWSR